MHCPSTITRCSICSLTHHFKACPTPQSPHCILCDGNHIAIAQNCPVRKIAITNLVQSQNKAPPPSNDTNNFPAILSNSSNTATFTQTTPALEKERTTQQRQETSYASITTTNNTTQNSTLSTQPIPPKQPSPVLYPYPPPLTQNSQQEHSNCNNNILNEWEIKLSIWKSFADKWAKDDHELYLEIMNEFLDQMGLSMLKMPDITAIRKRMQQRTQNKPEFHLSPISQPPPSPIPLRQFTSPINSQTTVMSPLYLNTSRSNNTNSETTLHNSEISDPNTPTEPQESQTLYEAPESVSQTNSIVESRVYYNENENEDSLSEEEDIEIVEETVIGERTIVEEAEPETDNTSTPNTSHTTQSSHSGDTSETTSNESTPPTSPNLINNNATPRNQTSKPKRTPTDRRETRASKKGKKRKNKTPSPRSTINFRLLNTQLSPEEEHNTSGTNPQNKQQSKQ